MKIHSFQDTMKRGPGDSFSIPCKSSVRVRRSIAFPGFRLLPWLHQKNHTHSPIKCLFHLVIYIILYELARFSNHFASSITSPFPSHLQVQQQIYAERRQAGCQEFYGLSIQHLYSLTSSMLKRQILCKET